MNKQDLQKNIDRMEKELAEMRENLKKCEELIPYDWSNKPRVELDSDLTVMDASDSIDLPFCFDDKQEAKQFAKQLELMSLILRLKKSLGDDWEFNHDKDNYYVYYEDTSVFDWGSSYIHNIGIIYFSTKENASKVADYLNKNWSWE